MPQGGQQGLLPGAQEAAGAEAEEQDPARWSALVSPEWMFVIALVVLCVAIMTQTPRKSYRK